MDRKYSSDIIPDGSVVYWYNPGINTSFVLCYIDSNCKVWRGGPLETTGGYRPNPDSYIVRYEGGSKEQKWQSHRRYIWTVEEYRDYQLCKLVG